MRLYELLLYSICRVEKRQSNYRLRPPAGRTAPVFTDERKGRLPRFGKQFKERMTWYE